MKIVLLLALATGAVNAAGPVSSITRQAVTVRGGGKVFGTGITDEHLAKAFVLQTIVNGGVGIPAPEKLSELYQGEPPADGSAAHLFWSYIPSCCAAAGAMVYLSALGEASTKTIAAFGVLPSLWTTWKCLLRGSFDKAGFRDGMGLILLLSFLPLYPLLADKGDAELIIKYFATVCFLTGVLGMFGGNDLAKNVYGVEISDGPTESAYKWMCRWDFLCGILLSSLVTEMEPLKALGYVCLAYVLEIVDFSYISKDRDEGFPNQHDMVPPLVILFNGIIACGLLFRGDNGGASTSTTS